jgi:hypothetical protein
VLNNGNPVFSNSYLDNQFQNPNLPYMVRACKLEEQASGSYYNLSLGIVGASQGTVNSTIHGSWEPIMEITPNPSRSSFLLKVEGMGSDLYSVEVVGLNGNMIRVESYSSEQLSRGISFSGLSAGVYAARVLKQNNSVLCSKKVVVLP